MDICSYPKRDLFIRIGLKYPCAGYYLRWYYNGWHYWHFLPGEQVLMTQGENYRTTGKKKITLGTGNITSDQVTSIKNLLLTKQVQIYTESGWVSVFIDPSSMIIYDHEVNGYEVELTITIGSKEISYLSGYSPVVYVPDVPASADPDICEVIIGTQIWMCKNYASNFPGSKVYNNNEANRDIYGGLYTWDQVMAPGFCPTGWRVPTEAEWNILINYLSGSAVAGGHLKEIGTDHWDAPNIGADNSSGFAARGAGYWNYLFNSFAQLKKEATFWTQTEKSATNAATARLIFDDEYVGMYSSYKGFGFSVRLIKNEAYHYPETGEIYDLDGNLYHWITIGDQQWLVENLKVTQYKDTIPIPNLVNDADWLAEDGTIGHDGAYCWYNNDEATYKVPYGALYNRYAVINSHGLIYFEDNIGNQSPGWRIPLRADAVKLHSNIGGIATAGGKLKTTGTIEAGTGLWRDPNSGATNEYGFSAVPCGTRDGGIAWFLMIGYFSDLWLYDYSMVLGASYDTAAGDISGQLVKSGFGVRCMRDVI